MARITRSGIYNYLICFWAASFLSVAQSTASPLDDLRAVLAGMGYDQLQVDGCKIIFGREVEPSAANNFFFRYSRQLNLETLVALEGREIQRIQVGNNRQYMLTFNFIDSYLSGQGISAVDSFELWVRRAFPESGFPYRHPATADRYAAQVNFEMHRRVAGLDQLNLFVSMSQFGPLTYVEREFSISYTEIEALQAFQDAVGRYSASEDCLG